MTERYHLTFDIDWAPDWSVRETLGILADHQTPATFFITHDSPVLAEIREAGHEVGIHPNFLAGSTQGGDPSSIVGELLQICPEARVMRTHGLVQGSVLLRDILLAHPQIDYDLSMLTYRSQHSEWTDWHLGGSHMRRLNYSWEDDFAFYDPGFPWGVFVPDGDLTVLDFHPIHVSLNSSDADAYDALKRVLGPRPLTLLQESEGRGVTSRGAGTRDHLLAVLSSDARAVRFEELL